MERNLIFFLSFPHAYHIYFLLSHFTQVKFYWWFYRISHFSPHLSAKVSAWVRLYLTSTLTSSRYFFCFVELVARLSGFLFTTGINQNDRRDRYKIRSCYIPDVSDWIIVFFLPLRTRYDSFGPCYLCLTTNSSKIRNVRKISIPQVACAVETYVSFTLTQMPSMQMTKDSEHANACSRRIRRNAL